MQKPYYVVAISFPLQSFEALGPAQHVLVADPARSPQSVEALLGEFVLAKEEIRVCTYSSVWGFAHGSWSR